MLIVPAVASVQLLSFFRSFARSQALWDTSRDGCYCHSHHLHVSPCPTPRTSALNNCPCPDVVSLRHNPLNPWTLTRFNRRHEASSSGRLPLNSLPLNCRLIGFFFPSYSANRSCCILSSCSCHVFWSEVTTPDVCILDEVLQQVPLSPPA